MVVLLIVVISQAVFASILLFFSNKNKLSNRLLATLILIISLWLLDNFFRIGHIYRQKPNLYFLPIFYSFAFGPLLYFYVKSLTNRDFKFKWIDALHFLPVLIQACLYIFLTFKPYAYKNWFWENIHAPYTYRIEFDGTWVSISIYTLLSFKFLRSYQLWLQDNFSETSKIKLSWLKTIIGILLALCIQWPIEIVLRDGFGIFFEYNYSILILGIIALVLGIGGLKQINLAAINYKSDQGKVEKSLSIFKTDDLVLEKIRMAMEKEQCYHNPTLSLIEFAKFLALNPKVVSKNINSGFNQSFNDFVNSYRIEEVKRRLKTADIKKMTILAIAFESGFNSKTTFHRIFKQFTGIAPSEMIE